MKPVFTKGFVRQYQELFRNLQRKFDKALEVLLSDFRHSSLRVKKMGGQRNSRGYDVWEARISKSYRFTFSVDKESSAYIFYRIGSHDIERRPS